jgi:hypothetical protein
MLFGHPAPSEKAQASARDCYFVFPRLFPKKTRDLDHKVEVVGGTDQKSVGFTGLDDDNVAWGKTNGSPFDAHFDRSLSHKVDLCHLPVKMGLINALIGETERDV